MGPIRDRCDYLIVGSGPGGAMLANSVIGSGARVVVLEAGPLVRTTEYHRDMGKTLGSYFWEGGMRATRGNVVMPTLQARVLGGGSVFNSAICMRPLDSALERWRDEHGLSEYTWDELDPYFAHAEAFANVKPVEPEVQGRRNELFREACTAMGWGVEPMPRAEKGCVGSGECITGCRTGAKQSLDRRGIAEFVQQGGEVYTSVEVDELIMDGSQVRGVVGWTVDPETKKRVHPVRITANVTILAAGPINTPVIARRSGLTREVIGSNLRFHPSCYILGVFDEEVNPWQGATQGYHSLDFVEQGIKLESLWATSSIFSMRMPRSPKQFKRYLKRYPRMSVFDAWVSGEASVGQVRVLPGGKPDLSFNLGTADARRLQEANAKLCELFAAVGASEVLCGIHGLPEVMPAAEAASMIRMADMSVQDQPTASNHVMGTMPMGGDPNKAACDGWGRVYDVDNLYVCDTSLYPSSPGVNPQLTVMALAHRLGQELPRRY